MVILDMVDCRKWNLVKVVDKRTGRVVLDLSRLVNVTDSLYSVPVFSSADKVNQFLRGKVRLASGNDGTIRMLLVEKHLRKVSSSRTQKNTFCFRMVFVDNLLHHSIGRY